MCVCGEVRCVCESKQETERERESDRERDRETEGEGKRSLIVQSEIFTVFPPSVKV